MIKNQSLTWGLVVATYQREKILTSCIEFATKQTRKPKEIVIIDASQDWERTRNTIITKISKYHPDINWIYAPAKVASSSTQRNEGIKLATADVLFLIDDDSLMYPTCAEEIMRVYEADTDGVVKGVQSGLVSTPPSNTAIADEVKKTGWSLSSVSKFGFIQHFLWKHLLLMNADMLWVPYNGSFPKHHIPTTIQQLNCFPVTMLHGCRMTYRRDVLLKEEFEPLLRRYAAAEDMDISNRITRHGLLVEANDAKLYHFHSGSSRLPRAKVAALSALNMVLFIKKNSNNLKRDQRRFYILTIRRIIAEFLKDGLSRRWSFPQVRGLLAAWKYSLELFPLPNEKLAEFYPRFQQEVFVSSQLVD